MQVRTMVRSELVDGLWLKEENVDTGVWFCMRSMVSGIVAFLGVPDSAEPVTPAILPEA